MEALARSYGFQEGMVELCITLDSAELCDSLCHLTAGINVTDTRAIDTRSGTNISDTKS